MILKNLKISRLFATTFNVILRRERSELSGESMNIMAIYYGNTTCDAAKSKKCLRDVELNDIRDSCNFCAEQKFCSIAVKF